MSYQVQAVAPHSCHGVVLVEAIVSAGLLVVLIGGIGRLMVMSSAAGRSAANDTTALFLAVQKIEQLRGLRWGYDLNGDAVSDFTTELAADPPGADGRGLLPSPSESLDRNIPGYVDFVDRESRWLGGSSLPPKAAFVRRWSIRRLEAANEGLLVLQVVVMHVSVAARFGGAASLRPGDPGVVWLTALKGRR